MFEGNGLAVKYETVGSRKTTSVIYPCGDKLNVGISPLSESPVSDVVLDHT